MSTVIKPSIVIGNAIIESNKVSFNFLELVAFSEDLDNKLEKYNYCTRGILYSDIYNFVNDNPSIAQIQGNNLIVHNEDLYELIKKYRYGLPKDVINCIKEVNNDSSCSYYMMSLDYDLKQLRLQLEELKKNIQNDINIVNYVCKDDNHVFDDWIEEENLFMDREWYYSRKCLICGKEETRLDCPNHYKRKDKRTGKVLTYNLVNGVWLNEINK